MRATQITILALLATLLAGAGLAALGFHFRPPESPPLARIDLASLVARQQQALMERVTPGMAADAQQTLFEEARAFGRRLDVALDEVAQECRCALIHSAALLKVSPESAIPDLTAQVAELVQPGAAGSSAK